MTLKQLGHLPRGYKLFGGCADKGPLLDYAIRACGLVSTVPARPSEGRGVPGLPAAERFALFRP
jgi:hypothetical protein